MVGCWCGCLSGLMPLPLTVSCFSKIQVGFTFLVPAHPGSPGKRAVKRVCVCVCVCITGGGSTSRLARQLVHCCIRYNTQYANRDTLRLCHIISYHIGNLQCPPNKTANVKSLTNRITRREDFSFRSSTKFRKNCRKRTEINSFVD